MSAKTSAISLFILGICLLCTGFLLLLSQKAASKSLLAATAPTPSISISVSQPDSASPSASITQAVLGVSAQVTNVVDGDTIDVSFDNTKERVRLLGINTPETVDPKVPVECFGPQASAETKSLLTGKQVTLVSDSSQSDRDKYGRLLRYIFLPDGTDIDLFLIEQGFAREYTYQSAYEYQAEFKAAQTLAKTQGKGLWGACK